MTTGGAASGGGAASDRGQASRIFGIGAMPLTIESRKPFTRLARNLLVTGHRDNRLPDDQALRDRIFAAVESVVQTFSEISNEFIEKPGGEIKPLRVLTGFSDGTDCMAAGIARKLELPLHLIAAHPHPQRDTQTARVYAERVALVTEATDNIEQPRLDALVAATDEAKLSLADAIIVVWDGEAPRGHAGGAVRLLIEALRRYTPIVWVDARTESAGKIRVLDPKRLDATTLVMLGDDAKHVARLRNYFSDIESDLSSHLERMLRILWNMKSIDPLNAALQRPNIEPGECPTWRGMFHGIFLSLFRAWKRKKYEPVPVWRGPNEFKNSSHLPEETWQWFDRVDRAATHAANKHRDNIVFIHLLSSFAVFGAVAAHIIWGGFFELLELGILAWILFMVLRNQGPYLTHDTWLNFRQAAEALRMSAALHPVLASLPMLHRNVWASSAGKGPAIAKPYHWFVIQLLREAGPPTRTDEGIYSIETEFPGLSAGLRALIDDQIGYHDGAYSRYHNTYHRLHLLTVWVFILVLLTVVIELIAHFLLVFDPDGQRLYECIFKIATCIHDHSNLFLLSTAFLPAFAAALHGITTKAELQRLGTNSKRMKDRLETLKEAVESLDASDGPMALRAVAIETAVTMYAEHDSWAELMADHDIDIPA
ncbi:MAG: hypothetical protein HQK89_11320 [Nitrospirae bacterium]|nr:hypothetical protein [Nitrospirota bacterium]